MDEPLIYTIDGNLPISSLILETEWDNGLKGNVVPSLANGQLTFGVGLEGYMVCKPKYYLRNADDTKGKLVREDCYVFHTGINLNAEQGQLQ